MEHHAVSSTWLHGDVAANPMHNGDLVSALGAVQALVHLLPGETDQCVALVHPAPSRSLRAAAVPAWLPAYATRPRAVSSHTSHESCLSNRTVAAAAKVLCGEADRHRGCSHPPVCPHTASLSSGPRGRAHARHAATNQRSDPVSERSTPAQLTETPAQLTHTPPSDQLDRACLAAAEAERAQGAWGGRL